MVRAKKFIYAPSTAAEQSRAIVRPPADGLGNEGPGPLSVDLSRPIVVRRTAGIGASSNRRRQFRLRLSHRVPTRILSSFDFRLAARLLTA
jgi:hypothetical protein